MGFGSIWPWIIVLAVVLLLFGRGKVSGLMGDVAQGMKSFRKGLADDEHTGVGNFTHASGNDFLGSYVSACHQFQIESFQPVFVHHEFTEGDGFIGWHLGVVVQILAPTASTGGD